MTVNNKDLWDEILKSPLFDKLYLKAPHHIEPNKKTLISTSEYYSHVQNLLSAMKTEATSDRIRDWVEILKKVLDEMNQKRFLRLLNYLCESEPDSKTKSDFAMHIGSFASFGEYKPENAYFRVLVIDDYFIFNIPIFIQAIRALTGKNSRVPLIHFDFECIPEDAINRCKEERYDLILLDIDFGLLDINLEKNDVGQKANKQSLKILKFATEQDPKIPIVMFSKYKTVDYYQDFFSSLGNVIGTIVKEDIRQKYYDNKLAWPEIIQQHFLVPLLRNLMQYYKVKAYRQNETSTVILRTLPESIIRRLGIYEIEKNTEIPEELDLQGEFEKSNNETLISLLKKDEHNLYDYFFTPYLNKENKLSLFILCRLPDFFRHTNYLKPILDRIDHYRNKKFGIEELSKVIDDIIDIVYDEKNFKYERISIQLDDDISFGFKSDESIKEKSIALIYRDLRYMVVPVFSKMSLLDIIGPIMIGPSSSHTAGANRIGRLARNFAETMIDSGKKIIRIEVEMLNSFNTTGEGHGSNRAIAAGLMGLWQYDCLLPNTLDDPSKKGKNTIKSKSNLKLDGEIIDIKGASNKEGHISVNDQNIEILIKWNEGIDTNVHNNTVRFKYDISNDSVVSSYILTARSWGGGNVQISSIKYLKQNEKTNALYAKKSSTGNFVEIDYSDETLDKMKDEYNGKRDIELKDLGTLKKIYEQPEAEIEKAIKQKLIDSNFKFRITSNSNEIKELKAKKPSFLTLGNLEEIKNELWKTALEYEMWYWQDFFNNDKNNFNMTPELIFSIFNGYYFLIKKVAEKSVKEKLNTKTSYEYHHGFELHSSFSGILKQEIDLPKIAMIHAIAINETNAKMILPILAAPTAGSCGVIPGVLIALEEYLKYKGISEEEREILLTKGLLVSALIGLIITNIVPPAGATHGCQAEIGTAGAMASAMATFVIMTQMDKLEKINEAAVHAATLSLDNSLGLICDPIGGKVEYPCIQRAGDKAAECMNIAFKVIDGVRSKISPSDIVWVMKKVGEDMYPIYKETSRGPYANSPSST